MTTSLMLCRDNCFYLQCESYVTFMYPCIVSMIVKDHQRDATV